MSEETVRNIEQQRDQAKEIYAIDQWGGGYFTINDKGHASVIPVPDGDAHLDLFEIARSIRKQGISFPVLVRFIDILRDRVDSLRRAFDQARASNQFHGSFTPVYPIKVNQQRKVIEGVLSAGKVGLEAGSKAELLAILGLSGQGVVVCNGYKDRAYIRLALIGLRMGQNLYIVVEKPSELELIIEQSKLMNIKPRLGVRIRLSSISSGKWQNSGGEKSKFGFHADGVLRLITRLKQENWLDTLELMHFHIGSQVTNIYDIKCALQEAGQFYVELYKCGAEIKVVDAGGGLGIDYDGSASRNDCSINYSLEEYAFNIIRNFTEVCSRNGLPQPDILTESGRALTAHHAVLITDVIDVEKVSWNHQDPPKIKHNAVESYHDAQFDLAEARARFIQGELCLYGLANAEKHYVAICRKIKNRLNPENHAHREVLHELNEKLADKVFCNFSLFQSMPDVWGIQQIFPIMPLQRLLEKPERRAVLQDLTCDSDGRIDRYIDRGNIEKTMPLHDIKENESYLIGFFLLGAYQEILGDMHNLFGDTHSINIELDSEGYHFVEPNEGDHVNDLLEYVHIDPDELMQAYLKKLDQMELDNPQRMQFERELKAGLAAYTYLEK